MAKPQMFFCFLLTFVIITEEYQAQQRQSNLPHTAIINTPPTKRYTCNQVN